VDEGIPFLSLFTFDFRVIIKILFLFIAAFTIALGMIDARRIMKFFKIGGSPTTPQSAVSSPGGKPVSQYLYSTGRYAILQVMYH